MPDAEGARRVQETDCRGDASSWLAKELSLLDDVMANGGARVLVWSSPRALVVSRRDAALAGFALAAGRMEQDFDTPVFVRETGGTAVFLDAGVVNVALVYERPPGFAETLDVAYRHLLDFVSGALGDFRMRLELGAVDGAYCDGAHNFVSNGLKIAGTAQRRSARRHHATLVHGSLLVAVDLPSMVERLNGFYVAAGAPTQYRAEVCTTIEREIAASSPSAPRGDALVRAVLERLHTGAGAWIGSHTTA
jgi:octanoyl-[GcvH]:protein N-octanoyltransferase